MLEQQRLAKISEETKRHLENVPEGFLRIVKCQGHTQYFHCSKDSTPSGTYISKSNISLAQELAQKTYNEKILRYTERTAKQLKHLLESYSENKIEDIYLSTQPARQKLITPVEPTYQQLLDKWLSIPYTGKDFNKDMPVITTNGGVRVRSKSEKILGDYFESIGLPYKYECPLHLKPYGTIYPDFTFLSPKTKREIYWEHDGMMDNPDYAQKAIQKIEMYEKNEIYPGDNLILTFETSTTVINMDIAKTLVQKYLC